MAGTKTQFRLYNNHKAHDVFISYSNQDKEVADALCATLERRKIRCWIAPRDVPPGQPWPAAIIRAIGEAKVFVLVFSGNANKSPQVFREVERAVSKEIPILPFRIEDVPPSDEMQYYIGSIHWLDALTPPIESHMGRLADTVLKLMEVVVEPVPQPIAIRRPSWRHPLLILAVVVLAVVALAFALNRWATWWAEQATEATRGSLAETTEGLTDTQTPGPVEPTRTIEATASVVEEPASATPAVPTEPGTPQPALGYLLPLPEPVDVTTRGWLD